MKTPVIAVDFDGTICRHEFPDLGELVPGAIEWMKNWQNAGAKLILYTMRHDDERVGAVLTDAIDICKKNGVEFWGINENPTQHTWTGSRKIYANIYVDDNAIGVPLIYPRDGKRPYVDWDIIGPAVLNIIERQYK